MENYEHITSVMLDTIIVNAEKYTLSAIAGYVCDGIANLANNDNSEKVKHVLKNVLLDMYEKMDFKKITVMLPRDISYEEYHKLRKSDMHIDDTMLYAYNYELLDIINKHIQLKDTNISRLSRFYKNIHKTMLTADKKVEHKYLTSKKLYKINTKQQDLSHENNKKSHVNKRAAKDNLIEFITEDIQNCTCPHIQYEKYLLSLAQTAGSAVNLEYRTRKGDRSLTLSGIHDIVKDVFKMVDPERKVANAPVKVKVPCEKHGIK